MSSKMPNKMLIDATHPEETRVVVVRGNRVEEFDFETAQRKQLRGNIYLAKVTRVEPSLQAAFIEYGGNRHGFLAFSEIHPDYYQIPVADRQALIEADAPIARPRRRPKTAPTAAVRATATRAAAAMASASRARSSRTPAPTRHRPPSRMRATRRICTAKTAMPIRTTPNIMPMQSIMAMPGITTMPDITIMTSIRTITNMIRTSTIMPMTNMPMTKTAMSMPARRWRR